jgi:hypothetical protein
MAKKKKQQKKVEKAVNRPKVSARPVNRSLLKAVRRDRRAHPSLDSILQRLNYRETVMARNHDHRLRAQRERFERDNSVESQARQLYNQFAEFGVTWAACVQAVKTNWVAQFMVKWGQRAATAKSNAAA